MAQIQISEDAFEDLKTGYLFHENRRVGLGDYFASCVRSDIESLHLTAGMHRILYRDYYRLLSKIFPYGIFYTFDGGTAVIWAVIDLRRNPEWIKERLSKQTQRQDPAEI